MKTLAGVLAALLLAVGLVACGGGGGDSSSSNPAETGGQTQSEGPSSSTQGGGGNTGRSEGSGSEGDQAANFVPKHHNDSGGGSDRYKTKGGDNSIQEFGEEAEGSEFEAVAAVLHEFLDARAEENWAAACTHVSEAIAESLEAIAAQAKQGEDRSCATILGKLVNPAAKQQIKDEAEQADVRSLRSEDDHAFVIYTGAEGTVLAMPMVNEGGTWKVSSLAGSPLS